MLIANYLSTAPYYTLPPIFQITHIHFSRSLYCSLEFPEKLLVILLSVTDHSAAVLPLIISSSVTMHREQSLFNGTPCRTADTSLTLEVSQLWDASSFPHFHSTNFLDCTTFFQVLFLQRSDNNFHSFVDYCHPSFSSYQTCSNPFDALQ